jgi:hypothetical protein
MSEFEDQATQPLSEHQVEQYMTAFHASLHVMDTDPAEASRGHDVGMVPADRSPSVT